MSTDLTKRILENVPAPMQSATRWCNWRYETRNDKRTKVPIRWDGSPASTTDPRTWDTLARVLAAPERLGSFAVDGVGYVFAAADGLVGVDLDGCRDKETGELTPFAMDVMTRLCTYTETSVSGTGIHLIARGTLPGPRRRTTGLEWYESGRFFVMSGAVLTPYGLEERTPELADLYAELFPQPPDAGPSPPPSAPPPLDDGSILRIARRAANGPKFARLWSGCIDGYGSHSEAELALCGLLAFYSGNESQLDRLYRASGLARDKWDSPRPGGTYGSRTLALALRPGPRFGVGRAA